MTIFSVDYIGLHEASWAQGSGWTVFWDSDSARTKRACHVNHWVRVAVRPEGPCCLIESECTGHWQYKKSIMSFLSHVTLTLFIWVSHLDENDDRRGLPFSWVSWGWGCCEIKTVELVVWSIFTVLMRKEKKNIHEHMSFRSLGNFGYQLNVLTLAFKTERWNGKVHANN